VLKLVKRAFDHVLGVCALYPHEIEQHAVTQVKRGRKRIRHALKQHELDRAEHTVAKQPLL